MKQQRIVVSLGALAIALSLVLVIADGVQPDSTTTDHWATVVEAEGDHITPRDLADRMLARKDDTLIVDVRPAEEFAEWHLPGAQNLPIPELLGDKGQRLRKEAAGKLIVLTSNGMVHPGQAWVALIQRGEVNARVLEGGLTAFKQQILTPPSLRGPISQASAMAEMPRFRAARAYFLSAPTAGAVADANAAVGTW